MIDHITEIAVWAVSLALIAFIVGVAFWCVAYPVWLCMIEPLFFIKNRHVPGFIGRYGGGPHDLFGADAVIYSLTKLIGLPLQLVFWILASTADAHQGLFAALALACAGIWLLGMLFRG